MLKKGRTDKEDYTFENYIDIMKEHLQNYDECFNKYNNNKGYSMKELYEDIEGSHNPWVDDWNDKEKQPFARGNPKKKFYNFNNGYYDSYESSNYEFIPDKYTPKEDRSEKIPFSEFLSRYEKIVSECNELTKIAIGLSKQLDAMIANSKYKDDVDYELNGHHYFNHTYGMNIYKRYNQVHRKKNGKTDDSGENYIWLDHFQSIVHHLSYSMNTLLDGKRYLDKEAELVTQALNEYNKQ